MKTESLTFSQLMVKKFGKAKFDTFDAAVRSYVWDSLTIWTMSDSRDNIRPFIHPEACTLTPHLHDPDYAAAFAMVQGVALMLGFKSMGPTYVRDQPAYYLDLLVADESSRVYVHYMSAGTSNKFRKLLKKAEKALDL